MTARQSVVLPLPVSPVSSSSALVAHQAVQQLFVGAAVRRAQEEELGIGRDREGLFLSP